MLPWKEPIAQEISAVENVLEIVLFVQDLGFWSPLETVNFKADQCCCLTLDTQKAKATLHQYKCVIPGKERFCYRVMKKPFLDKDVRS